MRLVNVLSSSVLALAMAMPGVALAQGDDNQEDEQEQSNEDTQQQNQRLQQEVQQLRRQNQQLQQENQQLQQQQGQQQQGEQENENENENEEQNQMPQGGQMNPNVQRFEEGGGGMGGGGMTMGPGGRCMGMHKGMGGGAAVVGPGQPAVPQYWVADALIFSGNAAHTARVMRSESSFEVKDPQVIGNQAQFLLGASSRSLRDLRLLEQNAMQTNPSAVRPIRLAMLQLVRARSQAAQLRDAAREGNVGPQDNATIGAIVDRFATASRMIKDVGATYFSSGE